MTITDAHAPTDYGEDAEKKWELVLELHSVSPRLGEWADEQFKLTCSIDRLKMKLRRAMGIVEKER